MSLASGEPRRKPFQATNELPVTGVVDTQTLALLESGDAIAIGARPVGPIEAENVQEWRDAVMQAAVSHMGAPYSWGGNGPAVFDCSGFVLYVLRQDTGLINWPDETAQGISNRLVSTNSPEKGDPVFYTGSSGVSHVEIYTGSGSQTLGASGGGSNTHGDDPNAKVKYGDYSRSSRSISFGSIFSLIEQKIASSPQ